MIPLYRDVGVNLKVQGLTEKRGAGGIELLKFEAKELDFAKILQKNLGRLINYKLYKLYQLYAVPARICSTCEDMHHP